VKLNFILMFALISISSSGHCAESACQTIEVDEYMVRSVARTALHLNVVKLEEKLENKEDFLPATKQIIQIPALTPNGYLKERIISRRLSELEFYICGFASFAKHSGLRCYPAEDYYQKFSLFYYNARALKSDFLLHSFVKGHILILLGPSSVGKSSTVDNLSNMLRPGRYHLTGADTISEKIFLSTVFQLGLSNELCDALAKVGYADAIRYVLFPDLYREEQVSCRNSLLKELCKVSGIMNDAIRNPNYMSDRLHLRNKLIENDLIQPIIDGKLVVVDLAFVDEFLSSVAYRLIHCKTDVVITYCPPKTLLNRMIKRNADSITSRDIANVRLGFPFHQYRANFVACVDRAKCIDIISREELENIFINRESFSQYLHGLPIKIREWILYEFSTKHYSSLKSKRSIMEAWFGPSEVDIVGIAPSVNHQLVLNTSLCSAQQCARLLLQAIPVEFISSNIV
jgi:hypothetical protein